MHCICMCFGCGQIQFRYVYDFQSSLLHHRSHIKTRANETQPNVNVTYKHARACKVLLTINKVFPFHKVLPFFTDLELIYKHG